MIKKRNKGSLDNQRLLNVLSLLPETGKTCCGPRIEGSHVDYGRTRALRNRPKLSCGRVLSGKQRARDYGLWHLCSFSLLCMGRFLSSCCRAFVVWVRITIKFRWVARSPEAYTPLLFLPSFALPLSSASLHGHMVSVLIQSLGLPRFDCLIALLLAVGAWSNQARVRHGCTGREWAK